MVVAIVAAKPKGIPMTKAKSKRKTASLTIGGKLAGRNRAARATAHNAAKPKPVAQSVVDKRSQSSAQQKVCADSKQVRIVAMLRAPSGTTIDAIAQATGWQQHSVRGFLAGIVRKKLGHNLISEAGESGRVYRINDRPVNGPSNKAA